MNPNASTFTPRFVPQAAPQPVPQQTVATQQTQQPPKASESPKVENQTPSQPGMDWEQLEEVAKEEDQILVEEMQKTSISSPAPSPAVAKSTTSTITTDDDFGEDGEAGELTFEKDDPREHLNVVFIGHVDAGKSTISGNILYMTGMVDDNNSKI